MQRSISRRQFAAGIGSIGAAGIGVYSLTGTSQLNIEDGEIAVSNSVGGTGNVTVKTAE